LARARRSEKDETIARLQETRAKLRRQWSARSADTVVSKHYTGAEQYHGALLDAEARPDPEVAVRKEDAVPEKKKPVWEPSHIDQLLRAKRQKTQSDKD
jgi:hypothetical protein